MAKVPPDLLAAFRAAESVADIGVLLSDDGFDATTMRVLAAWEHTENRWKMPKTPQPDSGRPTATAWEWICSGWTIDVAAVAAGAGVSREIARERIAILRHARLIYPDGESAQAAKKALATAIAQRLRASAGKKPQQKSGGGSDGPPAN